MSHQNKRPVTVEDLLRLKRNEQPAAEFWEGFDRQLRAKQLTALVEKRPWWQRIQLRPTNLVWRKYYLPLGAVAALAITLVSFQGYNSGPDLPAGPVNPAGASIAAAPAAGLPVAEEISVARSGSEPAAVAVAVVAEPSSLSQPVVEQRRESAAVVVAAAAVAPVTPLLGIETKTPPMQENVPAVAPFAAIPVVDSVLAGGLLASAVAQPVEEQVARSRASRVEPLTRLVVSAEPQGRGRLSALAIAAMSTNFPQGPAEHVVARHASSLSTDRVYQQPKGRLRSAGGNDGVGLGWGL